MDTNWFNSKENKINFTLQYFSTLREKEKKSFMKSLSCATFFPSKFQQSRVPNIIWDISFQINFGDCSNFQFINFFSIQSCTYKFHIQLNNFMTINLNFPFVYSKSRRKIVKWENFTLQWSNQSQHIVYFGLFFLVFMVYPPYIMSINKKIMELHCEGI